MRQKAKKIYITRVTVQVSSVPYDMMRYDACVPATELEAGKLERIAGHHSEPSDHIVVFRRFSYNPGPPTTERWASFNCRVIDWKEED